MIHANPPFLLGVLNFINEFDHLYVFGEEKVLCSPMKRYFFGNLLGNIGGFEKPPKTISVFLAH